MGKHDRPDWNEIDSYTAAEIRRLRAENATLKARVKDLEGLLDKSIKQFDKLKDSAIKAVESKDRIIEMYENKVLSLVKDYV